jgi:hypothetical protein
LSFPHSQGINLPLGNKVHPWGPTSPLTVTFRPLWAKLKTRLSSVSPSVDFFYLWCHKETFHFLRIAFFAKERTWQGKLSKGSNQQGTFSDNINFLKWKGNFFQVYDFSGTLLAGEKASVELGMLDLAKAHSRERTC